MAPPNGQVRNGGSIPNPFPSLVLYNSITKSWLVVVRNYFSNSPFIFSALASGTVKILNSWYDWGDTQHRHSHPCATVDTSA